MKEYMKVPNEYRPGETCDVYNGETLEPLKGKIMLKAYRTTENHNDKIKLIDADGWNYDIYHQSDCCEFVEIEDIVGDLNDLVGVPILEAEMVTNSTDPPKILEYHDESYTWTYIKIGTIKGHVNIRFYGSSNGYYSETAGLFVYRMVEDSK